MPSCAHSVMVEKLGLQLAALRRCSSAHRPRSWTARSPSWTLALEELGGADRKAAPAERPRRRRRSPTGSREARTADAAGALPRRVVETPPPAPARMRRRAAAACRRGRLRGARLRPGLFRVIRHVRPKFSCRACETIPRRRPRACRSGAAAPAPGCWRTCWSPSTADHLPLYRQSEIYARDGVELERSTLADWVGQSAALLRPLVDALGRHVLAGDRVHADDTPVPVLAPGAGKTKTGRLWAYVRDERPYAGAAPPAVLYRYSPDRRGEHPQAHLAGFGGVLQADGYAGFGGLYDGGRVVEAACWAHVRRKFFDLHAGGQSPLASEALERIEALYAIEAAVRGQPARPERQHLRRTPSGTAAGRHAQPGLRRPCRGCPAAASSPVRSATH